MSQKKKSCWEWISSKIQTTQSRLKKPQTIYLTFFVFKDGKVCYNLGTIKAATDIPINFTSEEIISCKEKAEQNGLIYHCLSQPNDDPVKVITFIKKP